MTANHLMDTVEFRNFNIVGADGPYLVRADGRKLLDLFTDTGTASLGTSWASINEAMSCLADFHFGAHAPNLYTNPLRNYVSERVCKLMGASRVFWCNSGTEAVEAAIKMARLYHYKQAKLSNPPRNNILSVSGGFHGRTYGAIAAGDGPSYHYEGMGPYPGGFIHAPIERMCDMIISLGPSLAAVIMAPVMGNNDVVPYETEVLQSIQAMAHSVGSLLIFDEVQTGSGRTGAPTYAQRVGLEPDITCLAKGIGMGFPVGLALARGNAGNAFTPGTHFSTFGGNPMSNAFVNVMCSWLENQSNLDSVISVGSFTKFALETRDSFPDMGQVRAVGMMIACDVPVDRRMLEREALAEGLLLPTFRDGPGTIKITPPLNIGMPTMAMAMESLSRAYKRCLEF